MCPLKNKYIVINSVLDGIIVCDLMEISCSILTYQGLQNNTVLTTYRQYNLWLDWIMELHM
jgi:hypothetical protein